MRVYIPLSWADLRALRTGPVRPRSGHAVTPAVREELGTDDEDVLSYAVLVAAAADALALATADDPRRLVVVAEATAGVGTLSEVALLDAVRVRDLLAIHADAPDAREAVLAGIASPEDDAVIEVLRDHDLAWYGVQELDELLGTASL